MASFPVHMLARPVVANAGKASLFACTPTSEAVASRSYDSYLDSVQLPGHCLIRKTRQARESSGIRATNGRP